MRVRLTGKHGTAEEALALIDAGNSTEDVRRLLAAHHVAYDAQWARYLDLRKRLRWETDDAAKSALVTEILHLAREWGFPAP